MIQKASLMADIVWRVACWPIRHRRLPNRDDFARLFRHLRSLWPQPRAVDRYSMWQENNRWTPQTQESAQRALTALPCRPLLSVIMPVFNTEERWLVRAVESVRNQVFPNWELCIADDASTAPHVAPLLARFATEDDRIRLCRLAENGNICKATNAAAELARGEFLVFLDHDDELTPDCLLEVAKIVASDSQCDIVYSDDDKIDSQDRRYDPQFKPDWSPELLLSYMYFSHVFCVRRELFERTGGCREGFEACQDYDLALRATEVARRIVHIPRLLYHWRSLPGSTAATGACKPAAFTRGIRAVQEALLRRGYAGTVSRPDFAVNSHAGLFQIDFPNRGPHVAILIATRNRLDLLRPCIDSILARTSYENYEIVVLDNGSDDPATLEYLRGLSGKCRSMRLASADGKFNFAWLHNEAARLIDSELLLMLNNDTEVRTPEWLSQMVGYAGFRGVGAVGARLLFPNGRIQHAGVTLGHRNRLPSPAFKNVATDDLTYLPYARVARNCSAVTAACLLIRRDTFMEAGGFDEARFAVAFNDVDLCLRLRKQGLRCVCAPRAELVHHEGATRGVRRDHPHEVAEFRRLWGRTIDPYYNPNLSLENEGFEILTRRNAPDSVPQVRVLFCSHNLNLEGAPLSLFELALGLNERGRVVVEVFSPCDGPLANSYARAGIPVHVMPYPLHDGSRGEDFASRTASFGNWTRELGFQLILGNTLDSFWAIHAARIGGLPALWIIRESVDWRTHFRQYGEFAAAAVQTFALPYRAVFVAQATRDLFEDLNTRHNFDVIPNGLRNGTIERHRDAAVRQHARRELGASADQVVFAILGTTCPRKGQLDFAKAAVELLAKNRRDVLFVIAGCRNGDYLEQIRRWVQPWAESFRLLPESDQALRVLAASDVFVCCSDNESYPRVVLEALALDKPIITTTVFGIAEQISPGMSALTFEPGDIDTLSGHMSRLAGDANERLRLGDAAAQQYLALPDYEEMVENYERLILEASLVEPLPAKLAANRARAA